MHINSRLGMRQERLDRARSPSQAVTPLSVSPPSLQLRTELNATQLSLKEPMLTTDTVRIQTATLWGSNNISDQRKEMEKHSLSNRAWQIILSFTWETKYLASRHGDAPRDNISKFDSLTNVLTHLLDNSVAGNRLETEVPYLQPWEWRPN